uniref:Putative RNA dependent RNA polymerase n=1 Tax=Insect narna-like virus 1 TaxID=2819083 RepID=A0A7H1D340_9VIRU|nr:putative RNA dependent RNA polymerase [Insect narna-like virus 1]
MLISGVVPVPPVPKPYPFSANEIEFLAAGWDRYQFVGGKLVGAGPTHKPRYRLGRDIAARERIRREAGKRGDQRFFDNLRFLQSIDCILRAVISAWEECSRLRSRMCVSNAPWLDRRLIRRFVRRVCLNPQEAAVQVKMCAQQARAYAFGAAPYPKWLCPVERHLALQFSYAARALPPPVFESPEEEEHSKRRHICDFIWRVCSEPGPEPIPEWPRFLDQYFRRFAPKRFDPQIYPSTSACLEFPRKSGGFRTGYQLMVGLGFKTVFPEGLPPILRTEKGVKTHIVGVADTTEADLLPTQIPGGWYSMGFICMTRDYLSQNRRQLVAPESDATYEERECTPWGILNFLFCVGVKECIEAMRAEGPPLSLPLYADEKGLKVRLPTCGPIALNILLQPLRACMDQVLKRDPCCSESVGGKLGRDPLRPEFLGVYSQDLSFATDLHPHWLGKEAYCALLRLPQMPRKIGALAPPLLAEMGVPAELGVVEYTEELVEWLLGPRTFVRGRTRFPFELPPHPYAGEVEGMSRVGIGLRYLDLNFRFSREDALSYYRKRRWNLIATSKRGAMMGDPTSFPVMSLCTRYAASLLPPRGRAIWSCGDDALIANISRGEVEVYNRGLESLGLKISKPKSFYTPRSGLFCEEPWKLGASRCSPYCYISFWSCPTGGSKGNVSWATQASAYREFCRSKGFGFRTRRRLSLLSYSKFLPEWRETGKHLDLSLPEWMGGLDVDVPFHLSDFIRQRHLGALASMPITQLALGMGLSAFPPAIPTTTFRDMRAILKSSILRTLPQGSQEGVPFAEVLSSVLRRMSFPSFYEGITFDENRVPSVLRYIRSFKSRVVPLHSKWARACRREKGFVPHLFRAGTRGDLLRKLSSRVDLVQDFPMELNVPRAFGPCAKSRELKVWRGGHARRLLNLPDQVLSNFEELDEDLIT